MAKRSRRRTRRSTGAAVVVAVAAAASLAVVVAVAVPLAGAISEGAPDEPRPIAVPGLPVDPAIESADDGHADDAWVERVSADTGIPARALRAYAAADLALSDEQPECGIVWNTLAGIGSVESRHGSYGGATLEADGWVTPRIVGPALDGDGFAEIGDTDGGEWDGDTEWDRAVGPMQFIPETWRRWGADGNGDERRDPNHIDDAALAAARYLCASGPMTEAESWRDAIFSYNPLTRYVDDVAETATEYARLAERE
ncbi:lytic transglycosylase domain-containing protein [Microbacterium dauci]|uniref:Lytic murein transglycosylase n=1 Tax=Microbacterium dauci TaxID=3048008 RepID=A0ABT6ZEH5_9MICO|nr:lytic murein transglycosylase [Microbacterium sp. LX3-4]MDJ1114564.1 lytic murein transglycosylase [Microbacterium sp. LX3-4]